jgi:rhodanese-related sulfurtransferase
MTNTKIFIIVAAPIVVFSGIIIFASAKNTDSAKDNSTLVSSINENPNGNVLGANTNDESISASNIYKKISIAEAKSLIVEKKDNQNFKILDIRTKEEFISGNIDDSNNIDFYGEFEQEISKLDKNISYLIYCRSGNRSGQAMEIFKRLEFKEVYDLEGGYSAWLSS